MPLKSISFRFCLPIHNLMKKKTTRKSTCTCPPYIIELQFNHDIRKEMLNDIFVEKQS